MRIRITFLAILALFLFPFRSAAQMDERKPGVYAIVGDESRSLPYFNSSTLVSSSNAQKYELVHETYRYRGETSGVEASHTFVLVVDPDKKMFTKTYDYYDIFVRHMTPINMVFVPLTVNTEEHRREYEPGINILGVYDGADCKDFDWERISENSFQVRVYGLTPGEYAVVFRFSKAYPFDFTGIYGFTINN